MFSKKMGLTVAIALVLSGALMLTVATPSSARDDGRVRQVTVPQADQFTPFALTIRAGDTVMWVNTDTDNHTVVSDDFFNTTNNHGANRLLLGTDNNGGRPGVVRLEFAPSA